MVVAVSVDGVSDPSSREGCSEKGSDMKSNVIRLETGAQVEDEGMRAAEQARDEALLAA